MSAPIPQRKPSLPSVGDGDIYQTMKDTVSGIWTAGIDIVGAQWQHDRELEMMELQYRMENQAKQANATGSPNSNTGTAYKPSLAAISPVTLALFGLGALVLMKG